MLIAVWLVKAEGQSVEQAIKTAEEVKTGPLVEGELAFVRGLAN